MPMKSPPFNAKDAIIIPATRCRWCKSPLRVDICSDPAKGNRVTSYIITHPENECRHSRAIVTDIPLFTMASL